MKKENRTNKKLVSAFGMLMLSAAMLGTATYAWFTMNKEVQVTDMRVKAVAEDGLLVNEVAAANDSHWDEEATAAQTAAADAVLLRPSSTTNGTTWYHAASKKANSAASATAGTQSGDLVNGYTTLSGLTSITSMSVANATAGSDAARETMGTSATADAGYYVHYTYYLKSSGEELTLGGTTGNSLSIKSVTATLPSTAASAALDPSVRVGIKLNSEFYIYAPVAGYTSQYYVAASNTATSPIAGTTETVTDLATLPANGSDGTPVDVYIWYEGEDAGCKSDNARATELDDIEVDITFSLTTADLP